MALNIFIKKVTPSNEPQTFPENSSVKPATAIPHSTPDSGKLLPFIDRVSVVLKVPPGEDAASIYSGMFGQFKDTEAFKSAKGGLWGPYKSARRVVLGCVTDQKKWPLLQYAWDAEAKIAIEIRTEFSPVDLGLKGLEQFHAQLISLVPGGWKYFVQHGRITMIEVTVDIPNVTPEDFHALPPQGPSAMMWKRDGTLETLVLGKSKGHQTKIYDRGKKRVAKGQGWNGPPTTRIERRLRLVKKMPLSKLPGMENPFAHLQMIVATAGCPPMIPKSKAYEWTLFLDSVRVRGLSSALKLLPEEKRTVYRTWLAKNPVSWWKPEMIWATWPGVVDNLKIASLSWK